MRYLTKSITDQVVNTENLHFHLRPQNVNVELTFKIKGNACNERKAMGKIGN